MRAHVSDVVLLRSESLLRWLIHISGWICDDLLDFTLVQKATILCHVDRGVNTRHCVIIAQIYHRPINHVLGIANVLVVPTAHHLIILHHDILFYNLCLVSIVPSLPTCSLVRSIRSISPTFAGGLTLLLGVYLV